MMLQRIPSTPNMNKRTINKNNPGDPKSWDLVQEMYLNQTDLSTQDLIKQLQWNQDFTYLHIQMSNS